MHTRNARTGRAHHLTRVEANVHAELARFTVGARFGTVMKNSRFV